MPAATEIVLPSAAAARFGERFPAEPIWTPDGTSFFVLDSPAGTVRRISRDGLAETARLDAEHRCTWLSQSSEGLLLTVSDRQEVWLLDPERLTVRRRLRVPRVLRAVSSPEIPVAFAVGRAEGPGTDNFDISVLDLKSGAAAKRYRDRDFQPAELGGAAQRQPVGFGMAAVVSGGRHLLTSGDGRLHRFRIEGTDIIHEQSGPRIGGRNAVMQLSPDGLRVCLADSGGNTPGAPDHPAVGGSATYVYPVSDLTRPAFALDTGAAAVGFGTAAGPVFALDGRGLLLEFSPTGLRLKSHPFPGGFGWRLSAHPAGRRLLVSAENRLYSVSLGEGSVPTDR